MDDEDRVADRTAHSKVLYVGWVDGLGPGCWATYAEGHRLGFARDEAGAQARLDYWRAHGR